MKMIKVEDFNLSADYDNGHVSNELVIALRIDDETAAELKNACGDAKPLLRDNDIMEQIKKMNAKGVTFVPGYGMYHYDQFGNVVCDDIYDYLISHEEKELDSMNNYEKIEITFKSGETISYNKDEWDDYAYDGKAVIVKKNSAWIGIYNFDDVFCVELK